jgi:hypothetical protein
MLNNVKSIAWFCVIVFYLLSFYGLEAIRGGIHGVKNVNEMYKVNKHTVRKGKKGITFQETCYLSDKFELFEY